MPIVRRFFSVFDFVVRFERKVIFSLFIFHALVFFFIAFLTNPITGDTPRYFELTDNLANNRFFGTMTANGFEPEGIRLFGYPLFILLCDILPGERILDVILVQGVLYLLSLFFVWKIVERNFNKQTALIFLLLLFFYPFIAYQSALIMPENVCLFLLIFTVFVLDFSLRKNFPLTGFAVAGFLLALTIYFRSNLLPLPFFLAFILLFIFKQNRKAVLFLPFVAILTILPAAIYNYQTFNKLSPVPVYGGMQTSVWMATWHARISTDSILRYRRGELTPELTASGMLQQLADVNRKIGIGEDFFPINMGYYPDNPTRERVQNEYGKVAIENIFGTPFVYLKSCFLNMFRMWFSAHLSFQNYSKILEYYLLVSGFTVFILGFAGMILLLKNPLYRFQPFVIVSASIIIFHSITLCWLHTEARYTIPARLFLAAFAAFVVSLIFQKMRNYFIAFEQSVIDT